MAKFKWRFTDRLPLSYQAAFFVLGLVIILSTVSFQMLPKNVTWGENFSTLVMDVSSYVATSLKDSTDTTASLQNHDNTTAGDQPPHESPFAETLSSPLPNEDFQVVQFPTVSPSAQDAALLRPRNESVSDSKSSAAPLSHIIEESWAPVPSDSDNSSVILKDSNKTSDASSIVTSAATPSQPPALVSVESTREKFLVPLLSYQVGAGNQFMEYLSAAVIARSLNRTLCLSPFFPGPSRHTGRVTSGLAWEDRYEVSSLSRFTRVASLQRCSQECDSTLDDKWMLKASREPRMDSRWKKYPGNNEALNLKWDYVKWTAPEDIFASLGSRSARCVGMLGLFPGLRWRGAFLAVSAFIQPAARINKLADSLQEYALGSGTRYLAVHWRFEESECREQHVGLCFVRCDDGSVIDSGLHPEAKEWRKAAGTRCNNNGRFRGVTLDKKDILDAIQERALNHSLNAIYLATDGWLRGRESKALVKEIVEALRMRGLTVVGLWKLPGLPNFVDGKYFDPVTTLGKANQDLNGAQIALVEQELCSRAASFMGSGPSTFSLSVFRVRLARRRFEQMMKGTAHGKADSKAVDNLIAETLLKDAHPAGLHCRYLRYMKRFRVNETAETYADEFPDGWLDLEACEGRIGRGGHCQVAACF